jgi:hypothetical protein
MNSERCPGRNSALVRQRCFHERKGNMWWWPQTSSELAQWVEAIGTMLAVIVALAVALFQDKMRAWIMRPKLDVSIDVSPPDCHKTQIGVSYVTTPGTTEYIDAYRFRLEVTNSGNEKAESVEVFAARLLEQQADRTFKEVNWFLPMNLAWSHFEESPQRFLDISPGTYKHCDLAHIIEPRERDTIRAERKTGPNISPDKTILSLDTIVKPHTKSYLLPFGTYRLIISVAASNAKADRKTLEIRLTGDWYDDEQEMLEQGIDIQVLD